MGDPDLDRFTIGTDVARSLLTPSGEEAGPYTDVFTQQILCRGMEGHVRIRDRHIPPLSLRSEAFQSEGVALRRLWPGSQFVAANGLDPETVSLLPNRLGSTNDIYIPAVPNRMRRHMPEDIEGLLNGFIRDTADSILSLIDDCRQLSIQVYTFSVRKALANTLGNGGVTESLRTEFRVEILTSAGQLSSTWVDWGSNETPNVDPPIVAGELKRRADQLGAIETPLPDKVAVLLPPGWGGTWMHEAVGHLLEADTPLSGHSPLHDLRGRRVAIDALTIVDNGALSPSRAGSSFDDEGVPTGETSLIQDGVVAGLLTDRESAARLDLPLTGNGRRPHYGLPPKPRMTNLLVLAGVSNRDAIMRSEDALIIVDRVGHAWLDVREGRLHLEIEAASLTHRGEFIHDLGPMVASAMPLELLRNITEVCDDFAVDLNHGYCVKDGATLPVTIGQPSVLIRQMQLSRPPSR